MAAITITAVSIGVGADAAFERFEVGEAVDHGELIYFDTANGDYRLADADAEASAKAAGIAVTAGAGDGSYVLAITRGKLLIQSGPGMVKGTEYYCGTTPGQIVPKSDLASGDYVTRVGIANSTTELQVDIRVTGVTL